MISERVNFTYARPIWASGKCKEINCSLWFETNVEKEDNVYLRISGNNDYQVFVNGKFCFYGPARAGRGYYRIDEINIAKYLTENENSIEILASAYNVDNFCFFNEEGFVCAEFVSGGRVFGETGGETWRVREYTQKIRKTQRYSFQRTFAEAYDHRGEDTRTYLPIQLCEEKHFIAREAPYPSFEFENVNEIIESGSIEHISPSDIYRDRAIEKVGNGIVGGFKVDELDVCTVWEAQKLYPVPAHSVTSSLPLGLSSNSYVRCKMSGERTGFIRLELVCVKDADVYITFDEILDENGKLNFTRLHCSNVVLYKLRAGRSYSLITAQPYSLQYLDIICIGGQIKLNDVGIIRLDFNENLITRKLASDADVNISKIYSAAVETFRQNAVDIYMDCPSRERAGWLCDSFFTARVEYLMTGKSKVERAFLANFAMEDRYYNNIPYGMLPMCYPSEHTNGQFIPNWSMWYVLELKEYLARTDDRNFIDALKDKIYRLLDYFKSFENKDGLLEKLESWVFVEWSHSNNLTQDINYPSNMLYYVFLNSIGELYGDTSLIDKAEHLKVTIRANSRCGKFFCDNSVYVDGEAKLSGECTESCQYYAFFTGVADIDNDRELWNALVNEFGPARKTTGKYPEIAFSNAFIGNYLRCELLMKNGLSQQLENDIRGYFLGMAERTGTLWEHDKEKASCNHGFASHVLIWLDYLGYIV